MRGVVSLAAALALPFRDDQGIVIAQRDTVLFISFVVIIFTLLIQGLTLPRLISMIKPSVSDKEEEKELNLLLFKKSLSFLNDYETDNERDEIALKTMVKKLEKEKIRLKNNDNNLQFSDHTAWKKAYFELELGLAECQRQVLIESYHQGAFSLETIRKKETELDFWTTTIQHEIESSGRYSE